MRNALTKWQRLAELGIQMMRKKIARMACMDHEIGFRNGAANGGAALPYLVVFEICRLFKHKVKS
jgi:hypothetical protein